MGRFITAIMVLVALIAAIVVLAPKLIPVSQFKGAIEDAAGTSLGRDVAINGEINFQLFPSIAFTADDVVISNPDGFEGQYFAKVARAEIGIGILPLLRREIELKQFVLMEPEIDLQRRKNGDVNWALGPAQIAAPEQTTLEQTALEQTELADETTTEPSEALSIQNATFGDVRLVDGKASYTDEASNTALKAEDVDLSIRLKSFDEPFEAEGTMIFQGAPGRLKLVIASLRALQDGSPSAVQMDAVIDQSQFGLDLEVKNSKSLTYTGDVVIDVPDLDALAGLFDVSLQDAPGFDAFSLKGQADGDTSSARIRNAAITFDAIDAAGDLGLTWSGARPKADGTLQIPTLDLRPYLPTPADDTSGFPDWSDAPMDFASLRNIDARLDISAGSVRLHGVQTSKGRMAIMIDNGRLTADIPQLALYNGSGSGRMVVNARRNTPSFAGVFNFTAIDAQPLAIDFLKNDRLLGIGALQFEFTASGASQSAIMSSVDGKGGFDLDDGAIKGLNLVKMVNAARTAYGGGKVDPAAIASAVSQARAPDDVTEYSKFLAAFNIQNGLISAPTIKLNGPYLTMTGFGEVNLPAQTIDLQLLPKVTTTPDGRNGTTYAVPIRVGGTFAEPTYSVDTQALLKSRLEKSGRNLLGRALGLDESGGEEPSDEQSVEDSAKSLLRGLLDRPSRSNDSSKKDR